MTDWGKLKVADLKEECKSRDIPLTGLKLKQHYIDKLEEYEAQNGNQSNENGNGDGNEQEAEEVEEQPAPQVNGENGEGPHADLAANDTEKDEALKDASRAEQSATAETEGGADVPSAIQDEDTQAKALTKTEEQPIAEAAPQPNVTETKDKQEDIAEKPKENGERIEVPGKSDDDAVASAPEPTPAEAIALDQGVQNQNAAVTSTPPSTENPSDSNTPHSSQVLSSDLAEDQRKRRKRSATPVPSVEDVARKRARLTEDAPSAKAEEPPEQKEAEIEEAKDIAGESRNEDHIEVAVKKSEDGVVVTKSLSDLEDTTPGESKSNDQRVSTSPPRSTTSEDRDIPPAIHPATSAIYIRNFKRPLHIPSLRGHIASIAKSRSSDNADPITTFYLDSIRTHAFVSFTSIAAASRVRSAIHGSRFPDEPLREPLFVDYVPPNKVQTWIDQETGSGFGRGGGGGGRRFEVTYEEGESGIDAIFQEVDTTKPRPPPFEPSRGSRSSFDRQQAESLSAGVHPDRGSLIPRDNQNRERQRRLPAGTQEPSSNNGKGFKALDELFNSTSTKPKLYYKPVPLSVANERLDMFRGLRSGWEEMGRSGDEGMKRYSFERDKNREEWVDKGPEFGYGRRGQTRLVGVGGGRGRGGPYRGRTVDSWRGGGR